MKKKTGESAALAIGAGRKNRATSTGGEQGGGAGGAAVTPPRPPRAEGTVVTRSAAKEGERVAREEAVSTHTRSHKKKAAEE
jgi:hypothetical protein